MDHDHHGNSVAAWTAVGIVMLAFAVMSWAVLRSSVPMFVVGALLVVVGLVAGKVLAMAGYGVDGKTDAGALGK